MERLFFSFNSFNVKPSLLKKTLTRLVQNTQNTANTMPFSLKLYNILKFQRISQFPSLMYPAFATNCHHPLQTFYSNLYFFVHLCPVNAKTGKMKNSCAKMVLGLFYECKYDTVRVMGRWELKKGEKKDYRTGIQNCSCTRKNFKIKLVLL